MKIKSIQVTIGLGVCGRSHSSTQNNDKNPVLVSAMGGSRGEAPRAANTSWPLLAWGAAQVKV